MRKIFKRNVLKSKHILELQPGTVEENSSTIGPHARIEPIRLYDIPALLKRTTKARFICRPFVVSNAIQTINDQKTFLIVYCSISLHATEFQRKHRA